jgi:molybdopterin-guanine dinucleotide biosynthesis protein A
MGEVKPIADLLGVVLCGGESRRMGKDKGLLKKDGRAWALFMADKLDPWKLPVIFSINTRQRKAYAGILPAGDCVVDALGLAGPLEGLFSVHRKFPHRDLFLLSCDMLDLDHKTIARLLDAYRVDGGKHDFYVYGEEVPGRFLAQPFCGIYTAAGLNVSYSGYPEKSTIDFSLQSLLHRGRTYRLPIEDREAFRNYNTI